MRYAAARVKRERERDVYRVYVSDMLKMILDNVAQMAVKDGGGQYIRERYFDVIHPKPEETRTAQEIIDHIRGKLGGASNESI